MKKLLTIISITITLVALMSCGSMRVVTGVGSGVITIDNKKSYMNYNQITYYVNYTLEQVEEELHIRQFGNSDKIDFQAKLMLLNPHTGEFYTHRIAVRNAGGFYTVAYYYDGDFHSRKYTLDEDYIIEKAKEDGKL